jgi:hypothetical protein
MARWLCECSCGGTTIAFTGNLRRGHTQSCGCLQMERTGNANRRHGESKQRISRIWSSMKARCTNPTVKCYPRYGGRGIKVCEEWDSYENFRDWALLNGYKDGLTVDRINNDGDYEPGNCRWTTKKEQSNNMRSNVRISFGGEEMTVAQWSRKMGFKDKTLHWRLKSGWSIEKAITTKVRTYV